MNKIPFSIYDFFGYLASGFLVIMAVEYVFARDWMMNGQLSTVLGIFWTVISYILGQILAGPSAWLLERMIIVKWLGRPSVNLLRDPVRAWWVKLFPGYFTPLPHSTRDRVLAKAKSAGVPETGEALFLHAFANVKGDKEAIARLDTFLNLYGFCRNICFTCLVAALILATGHWQEGVPGEWVLIALAGSIGMFYRYLKFFRQYSFELFVTYAEL